MKKRFKMSKRASKSYFRKSADLTHKKNYKARPMRGGIQL